MMGTEHYVQDNLDRMGDTLGGHFDKLMCNRACRKNTVNLQWRLTMLVLQVMCVARI